MINIDFGSAKTKKEGYLGLNIVKSDGVDIVSDICNLQLTNCSVDNAYSRRCIQHIKNDLQAIKEIYRVIKPNAEFIMISSSWVGYLYYKIGFSKSKGNYKVFHCYTQKRLEKLMKDAGFTHVCITKVKNEHLVGYDYEVRGLK